MIYTNQSAPPLKVGQVWQCRHQAFSAKVITEIDTGVYGIAIRAHHDERYESNPEYLMGRPLAGGAGWGWLNTDFDKSWEMTNLIFDPVAVR